MEGRCASAASRCRALHDKKGCSKGQLFLYDEFNGGIIFIKLIHHVDWLQRGRPL